MTGRRMKHSVKRIQLFCFSLIMVTLISCGKAKSRKNKKAVIVQPDNVTNEIDKMSSTDINGTYLTPDIDMTKMSVTMIYSQIFNMLIMPEEYEEKIIKVRGAFEVYPDENNQVDFFTLTVMDATACCAQGIEFILTDDYKYPDDYPEPGEEVCVVGTFDTYKEGDYTYCTLRNARML